MDEPGEGHTVKAWDGALSGLRGRALRMGTLVAQQVETAVRALLESDREAAELVLRREQQINAWQTEIEAESFRLLARQAPVASRCTSPGSSRFISSSSAPRRSSPSGFRRCTGRS